MAKRKAEIVLVAEDAKRCIAIDSTNARTIFAFLREKKLEKKFDLICKSILRGIKNTDLYDKENINDTCRSVTAMKFKGKQNTRIYCKEQKRVIKP